jgi:glycosyltransferase involved in cell wall biosynthesis
VNQISRARNAGAAAATGEWIVFVDADSSPSAALFGDMLAAVAPGGCLAGGATIAFPPGAGIAARCVLGLWNAASRAGKWAAGSFIFCEAAAFREAGGFSELLFASEELELFRRLKRLARARRGRIEILHRHPIRTSDRKLALHGWAPYARLMVKTLVTGGRTLRRREDCSPWYDGRR